MKKLFINANMFYQLQQRGYVFKHRPFVTFLDVSRRSTFSVYMSRTRLPTSSSVNTLAAILGTQSKVT